VKIPAIMLVTEPVVLAILFRESFYAFSLSTIKLVKVDIFALS
jgi:hypothetical protein